MPQIDIEKIKNTLKHIEKIKVFTIKQLAASLNCSIPSARLKIREWRTITSYNHNGQYYALPSIPHFDENGFWRFNDIYFSKHGNLHKTVIHLVSISLSGLTGKQIGDLIGLSPQSFLHHFRDLQGICREKHDGVYVYFSDTPDTYKQQQQNRASQSILLQKQMSLSHADAIVILVALIKHYDTSIEDILMLPEIKRKNIPAEVIRSFLESHELLKKILDTRR